MVDAGHSSHFSSFSTVSGIFLVPRTRMAKGQPIFHALVTQDALAPTAFPVVIEAASTMSAESLAQRLPDGCHQGFILPTDVRKHALSCFDQAQPHYLRKVAEIGWLARERIICAYAQCLPPERERGSPDARKMNWDQP